MKEELVSVIIPIYNASKYLGNTIECILNQTYKNLEIILINDGSTDDSLSICNDYCQKDNRIIVIDKVNSGQADSRNAGIEECKGKYIYFADSDDDISPELIETAVVGMKKDNSDLFIFNYYKTYIDNGKRRDIEERAFLEGEYIFSDEKDRLKFYTNNYLNYGCGFEVWNRLYKSEIIKDNNVRFPVFTPVIGEDMCFNLFYMMHIDKVRVTNERLYHYLIRNDSSMGADRSIVRISHYNMISCIFEKYIKSIHNELFEKYYDMIHILLIYHELMNMKKEDIIAELDKVDNKAFMYKEFKGSRFKMITYIKIMGILRGIKYNLMSEYYYKCGMGKCYY